MKKDANQIQPGSELSCHICIIGAGAAGITIARELNGLGKKVLLLEAGGYETSQDSQEIYQGKVAPSAGQNFFPENYPELSRLRFFGGSTNHWGGWCRPLEAIDFQARPWVPKSGWPIKREEIAGFYAKAAPVLTTDPFDFTNESRTAEPGFGRTYETLFPKPLAKPEVMFRYFHFTEKLQLGELYKGELWASENVEVITNSSVTRFDCDPSGKKVEKLQIKSQNGNEFIVSASLFVLACGGLENPRLLLNSSHQHANGLGNRSDLVGRCFMEHPHAPFADFINFKGNAWAKPLLFSGDGPTVIFATTPEFQAKNQTLNFCTTVDKTRKPLKNFDKIHSLMKAMGGEAGSMDQVFFFARTEMEPHLHNRVSLTGERDRLGLRKLSLSISYSEKDRLSLKKSMQALIRFLSFQGMGRGRLAMDDEDAWCPDVSYGCHHMGTTRMSSNPKEGVVDANCKVHELANLYVGGSSVFPTSGFANPTFTIVALALRLAQHLKEKG